MSLFLISCVKHIYQTHNTFHPNVVGYSSFWKISCIIEFLPQIDSNPQPMSYFRPQEEVGHETSKHGYWVHKIVQPNIVGYTCSRRDKCLFNFQHHWNAVHRVRPRSSELCNWMPYSVGLLHIVCTPYIQYTYLYINTQCTHIQQGSTHR